MIVEIEDFYADTSCPKCWEKLPKRYLDSHERIDAFMHWADGTAEKLGLPDEMMARPCSCGYSTLQFTASPWPRGVRVDTEAGTITPLSVEGE